MNKNIITAPTVWAEAQMRRYNLFVPLTNHRMFYTLADKLMRNSLVSNGANVCAIVDTLIGIERCVFNKSFLLNGIMNFLIANSDGETVQHKMFTTLLSTLLNKYY
jgi:hypothetical protein